MPTKGNYIQIVPRDFGRTDYCYVNEAQDISVRMIEMHVKIHKKYVTATTDLIEVDPEIISQPPLISGPGPNHQPQIVIDLWKNMLSLNHKSSVKGKIISFFF